MTSPPHDRSTRESPGLSDFLEWDVHNWSAALDFWSTHTGRTLSDCHALEIGSGRGGLSLWMAMQGGTAVCSDIAGPSQKAVALHEASGVSGRIEYSSIDATRIPYSSVFDVILFKSVLGGIGYHRGKEGQRQALGEMHRALKPGGQLFFAENLISSPLHRMLRRRFVSWGKTWRYVSVPEMREFLSPFSRIEFRTVGFAGAFGRTEPQRKSLGMLDTAIFNRIIPEPWRYIIVGIATK